MNIKVGVQARVLEIDKVNEDERTVEVSFSSESKVKRHYGIEVLSHNKSHVDMEFIRSGNAPLLLDHDRRDIVGVVEYADIVDDRGKAIVRFGSSAKAQEVYTDVKDGIRKNISVGYTVSEMEREVGQKGKPDKYLVTNWKPVEVSIVSVPADSTVGIERSDVENQTNVRVIEKDNKMNVKDKSKSKEVNLDELRAEAMKVEQTRAAELMEMGTEYNVDATSAVKEGKTVNEFRAEVLGTVSSRMKEVEMKRNSPIESAEIGMTDAEVSNFSFTRAINALANPTDRQAQEAASFEFEASRAASDRAGVTPQGLFVPVDVMTRDLNTTSGSAVIGDTLAGSSFIEMLDSYMVTSSAGATIMRDLNGNISIPRQTSGATSYWVTDGTPDVTESEATFDQVPLSAKTIGALTDIGRRLLSQSSVDIEGLIRKDLAQRLALGIDAKALETIAAATGIGVVTLGGGAPTFEEIVALETAVATDNALVGNLAYVAPAGVVGGLKTTSTEAGSGRFILENGQANGYGVYTSNNTSETIFGNFADLIMGYWGGLDINVDTATNSKSGAVRVVALQDVDFGIRHGESFAKTA